MKYPIYVDQKRALVKPPSKKASLTPQDKKKFLACAAAECRSIKDKTVSHKSVADKWRVPQATLADRLKAMTETGCPAEGTKIERCSLITPEVQYASQILIIVMILTSLICIGEGPHRCRGSKQRSCQAVDDSQKNSRVPVEVHRGR